jgi:asparagine synthase (glutamine-hydrolysing)
MVLQPNEATDRGPVPAIIQRVRADGLTYLDESALHDLHDCVTTLERERRQGALIEAGCALGGSAIVLAAAKAKERPLFVYDVFGMIPPPSEHDGPDVHARYQTIRSGASEGIGGNKYYGYEEDLLGKVKENVRRHGIDLNAHHVQLVQGLFEDTLHVRGPVALAHIDGDWYHSVMTCLRRIEPHLVPGGALVIDDYDDWSGCRKAVDEYFADNKDRYQFVWKSRLHVVRA